MQNSIGTFLREARGFSQNPLGIIALFITFIYALACAVLGASGSGITIEQKWPIIYFVVIFPVCVLIAFLFLVVKHHSKLYAPSDYRTDESFLQAMRFMQAMRPMSSIEQIVKLDESEREVMAENNETENIETENIETENNETVDVTVHAPTATSHIQANQEHEASSTENLSVSKNLSVRETYIIAEDLVLRELEAEFGTPIQRRVRFWNNPSIQFDGAMILGSKFVVIEIKYTRKGVLSSDALASIQKIINSASDFFNCFPQQTMGAVMKDCELPDIGIKNFRMIIAIAYEGQRQERLREQMDKVVVKNHFIDYRLYNFDDLKKQYGVDLSV